MSNLRSLLYKQAPLKHGCIYALINSKNGPIEYDIGRGEFLMDHNTEYSFIVGNFHETLKASVTIEIDGVCAGTFVLDPDSVNIFERPVTVNRKFTFVDRDSQSGKEGKLHMKSVSDLGRGRLVIQQEIPSVFKPLDPSDPILINLMGTSECEVGYDDDSRFECEDSVGGTVLGDTSKDRCVFVPSFDTVELCVFNFRMALRPKVIPMASTTCTCCQCPQK
jgi:hypothetical protein